MLSRQSSTFLAVAILLVPAAFPLVQADDGDLEPPPYDVDPPFFHYRYNKCNGMVDCAFKAANNLFQLDGNRDGYGDDWQRSYQDYAWQLVDRLNDSENNFEGDGLTNIDEFRWLTIPIGPIAGLFLNAQDYDQDGFRDGGEVSYWNNEANDPRLDPNGPRVGAVAALDPDYSQSYDDENDTEYTTHDSDSDNDTLTDGAEFYTWGTFPEFEDSDCSTSATSCLTPAEEGTTWFAQADPNKPGSGDSINDSEELARWTQLWGSGAHLLNFDYDGITSNLLDPDADNDAEPDGSEFHCQTFDATNPLVGACTRPDMPDTDRDGLNDGNNESQAGTNPLDPDTDGDSLPDGWEHRYRLSPRVSNTDQDSDRDGLLDSQEYAYHCKTTPCPVSPVHWSGLDPLNPDIDGDMLLDGEEVAAESDPFNPDTDYDGLDDGEEVHGFTHGHHTSPTAWDTDQDGLSDYQEIVTYRLQGPDPLNPNTDGSNNGTNDDILTDFQELVRYRTNATHWDTDEDGEADGRDGRPLDRDYKPKTTYLGNDTPIATPDEAYVVFRNEGYIDIVFRDTHENEQDVLFVTAHAHLEGTYKGGGSGGADTILDATRGDNGAVWGARMPLPERFESVHGESFSLVVVTKDGNTREYVGEASEPLDAVEWKNEADPTTDWAVLADHSTAPSVRTGSSSPDVPIGGSITGDASSLIDGLAVYRLKPFILTPSPDKVLSALDATNPNAPLDLGALGLSDVPGASAFGVLQTVAWDRAPDGTPVAVDLSGMQITVVQDAFEYVDPVLEKGVYDSIARAPYASPGIPLWRGLLRSWMPSVCAGNSPEWCASYYYGPHDPRAKGNTQGDAVAGIIGYRDYQGMIASYQEGENVNAGIHAMMLAMTWGPAAFAAAGKLGGALKAAAATDAAFSSMLLKGEATSVAAGDLSISTADSYTKWAAWGLKNPGQTRNALLLARGSTYGEIRFLSDEPMPVSEMAGSIRLVLKGDDGKTVLVLNSIRDPNTEYFIGGGAEALKDAGILSTKIRSEATRRGYAADQIVGEVHVAFYELQINGVGGREALFSKLRGQMLSQPKQGWGYVFEATQDAKLVRGEFIIRDANGVPGKLGLFKVSEDGMFVDIVEGGVTKRYIANVDAIARMPDGRQVLTEFKAGPNGAVADTDKYDLMNRQAAIAWQTAEEESGLWAKELHWRFEDTKEIDENLINYAKGLMSERNGLEIRFFDRSGAEIPIV